MKKEKRFAAVAIIIDKLNKKILLSQRHQPTFLAIHEKWQFPGGTIEFGEHPKDTTVREVKEELGIDIDILSETPFIHSFVYEGYVQGIIMAYPAKQTNGKIDVSKDPQTKAARWFSLAEIETLDCLPEVKKIIEKVEKLLQD
ncbi:MAG: NUDIX hydrolase [Patescibacteria group bacterium]|nr:NUDIX hydrolase [Patescibacteria group bacterium]